MEENKQLCDAWELRENILFITPISRGKKLFTFSTTIKNWLLCFRLAIWNQTAEGKNSFFHPLESEMAWLMKRFLFRSITTGGLIYSDPKMDASMES